MPKMTLAGAPHCPFQKATSKAAVPMKRTATESTMLREAAHKLLY